MKPDTIETTPALIEQLVRATIDKLREALEDYKTGMLAGASVAATVAKNIAAGINDRLYAVADAKYHFPPPDPTLHVDGNFAARQDQKWVEIHGEPPMPPPVYYLPPVHPKCIVVQCVIRPELPPHQDYTSAKFRADMQGGMTE